MFDRLIGNESAKRVLSRLVISGRLPQSLLFTGRSGIGKRLFALELAKQLVCHKKAQNGPCQQCPGCKKVTVLSPPRADDRDAYQKVIFTGHPDVGLLMPFKQTIFVDAVRDLEKEANYRPFEASARFFIVDEAEKLSSVKDNAANALLKTLEEPSESTHIILISSRPLLLLPTIRSRCQTVSFGPIKEQEIINELIDKKDLPPEDAKLIAGLSRGSLGRALSLDIGTFRDLRKKMLDVVESCSKRENFAVLLRRSEELCELKTKADYEEALYILQTLIHDIWTIRRRSGTRVVNVDLRSVLMKLAEGTEVFRLELWMEQIDRLREELGLNLNKKLATDALFMKMAA